MDSSLLWQIDRDTDTKDERERENVCVGGCNSVEGLEVKCQTLAGIAILGHWTEDLGPSWGWRMEHQAGTENPILIQLQSKLGKIKSLSCSNSDFILNFC